MHKHMRWGKLIFLCMALLVAFFVGQNQIRRRIDELNSEEIGLRFELSNLREEETELNRQIEMVGTDVYVISVARSDAYNFVKPGEMRFEYENPGALKEYSAQEREILNYEMSID